MSFEETFSDLRSRRRIPMSLFEERVGINRSYIHQIEKEGLLPSPEKLEALASVFVEVASEQEAVDPEGDERRLVEAREKAVFVERLGLDPKLSTTLVALGSLDKTQRSDLAEPMALVVDFLKARDSQERRAVAELMERAVAAIEQLPAERQTWAGVKLAEAIEGALDEIEEGAVGRDQPTATPPDPAPVASGDK